MSILMASYTAAMSRLPVLPSSSSHSSWRPSVVFKPSYAVRSRQPLTVSCALPEKERPTAFSIPPTALLCPVPPPDGKERWGIKDDVDSVTLWLQVPGMSANDIEVTTTEDVLEINRKVPAASDAGSGGKEAADVHGVGEFRVRLLMTKLYKASEVTADLKDGMLEVVVPRNNDENSKGKLVRLGPTPTPTPSRGGDASGTASNKPELGKNNNQRQSGPGLAKST